MKRLATGLAVIAALTLAPSTSGCGGCISQAEADERINDIASGAEFSSGEVEAKQQEIREVRAEICEPAEE